MSCGDRKSVNRNSHCAAILVAMIMYPRIVFLALTCAAGGFAGAQSDVKSTLPNGRQIEPVGRWIPVAPYPFAVALREDGAQAAAPSIGFPFALNVVDEPLTDNPQTRRFPNTRENDPEVEVDAGVAYSPDGKLLYVSTGDSGKVRVYRTSDWAIATDALLNGEMGGRKFEKSFAGALAISRDGKFLFVIDEGNWRVVVLNAESMEKSGWVGTGRYPFGLALSPDGSKLYVTNTGLFEYRTIPGVGEGEHPTGGLRFPPFGYPSEGARAGAVVENQHVPGLGDENSDEGSSLWTIDVRNPAKPEVIGEAAIGGSDFRVKWNDRGWCADRCGSGGRCGICHAGAQGLSGEDQVRTARGYWPRPPCRRSQVRSLRTRNTGLCAE